MAKKIIKRFKKCKGITGTYNIGICENGILKGQKLCDTCLLNRFRLDNGFYDSEDVDGITLLFMVDDVVRALRDASKL